MSVRIRPATGADAAALAALAARTFRETYTGLHDPGELAAYLARAFGPERQAAELADPAAPAGSRSPCGSGAPGASP